MTLITTNGHPVRYLTTDMMSSFNICSDSRFLVKSHYDGLAGADPV